MSRHHRDRRHWDDTAPPGIQRREVEGDTDFQRGVWEDRNGWFWARYKGHEYGPYKEKGAAERALQEERIWTGAVWAAKEAT